MLKKCEICTLQSFFVVRLRTHINLFQAVVRQSSCKVETNGKTETMTDAAGFVHTSSWMNNKCDPTLISLLRCAMCWRQTFVSLQWELFSYNELHQNASSDTASFFRTSAVEIPNNCPGSKLKGLGAHSVRSLTGNAAADVRGIVLAFISDLQEVGNVHPFGRQCSTTKRMEYLKTTYWIESTSAKIKLWFNRRLKKHCCWTNESKTAPTVIQTEEIASDVIAAPQSNFE